MENTNTGANSSKASEIIKRKLKECGGHVTVYSQRGKPYIIRSKDDKHFYCPQMILYKFSIFDVIIDLLISQNGRANKGKARLPLGAKGCEEQTVAGTMLKNYFGKMLVSMAQIPWLSFLLS